MTGIRCIIAILSVGAALASCTQAGPSKAERVRALPPVSMDAALAAFNTVCGGSRPTFANAKAIAASRQDAGAYIFDVSPLKDGTLVCSMRARLPEGQQAFHELQRRYGFAKSTGSLVFTFNNYPGGQLLFMSGIQNAAGAGTFQIGLMSGRTL